jgi:predicted nuclease of predicted toxin-antitoxin system
VKLLFDENLSPRLIGAVSSHWQNCVHVESLGMRGAKVIWLEIGNASTSRVAELLRANAALLEDFAADPLETLQSLTA